MSVLTGFYIIVMIIFLGYSLYRLGIRRQLPMLIAVCAQVFALSIAVMSFAYNIELNNIMQAGFLLLGFVLPFALWLYDFCKVIYKLKQGGKYEGFVERPPRKVDISVEDGNTRKFYGAADISEENGKALKKAVQHNPGSMEALEKLGQYFLSAGNYGEAADTYNKIIELKPDDYRFHACLATALDETGRLEEAEIAYRKVISLKPDFTDAYNNLGVLLASRRKYSEAVEVYKSGLKVRQGEYMLLFNLGVALEESSNFREAEKVLSEALGIKPEEAEICYHLGAVLSELHKYEAAAECYKKALKSKPEDGNLYYNIAVANALMKKNKIAIENLKRAIRMDDSLKKEAASDRSFLSIRSCKEFKELVS